MIGTYHDEYVLTCTHVMNGARYEYVEKTDKDGVESFTCSECLEKCDIDENDIEELRCIHQNCFVALRIGKKWML